jgi:DNA-binding MarR family transcriptional regulator
MTDRSASPRSRGAKRRAPSRAARASSDDVVADYARRGPECAFANVRLLGRVVTRFYDEALKPVDLRASQVALMWAVVACEPVELGRLGDVTQTDQTTLSRTVEKLRTAGLVAVETGSDRRVRVVRMTAEGRRRFAQAMPYWDVAQRTIDRWLSVTALQDLARRGRRLARQNT